MAQAGIIPGSFDDLIVRFYESRNWKEIRASTREQYRGQLDRFRKQHGHRPVATVRTRHIQIILDGMIETPVAANNLRKRLKQLMNFAISEEFRTDNPVLATRALKVRSAGFPDWSEEDIARFEATHEIGSKARVAFDLALFTAQRKADIRLMGPSDIVRGKIKVRQEKTEKELLIPLHPCLAASLMKIPGSQETFIQNNKGQPYTIDSFGMWFKRRCLEAGIKGKSMHGLRKSAARRLAEVGLSNQIIKSITGHSSDAEVARYTAGARQARMAETGIGALDLANLTA
ncbi:site-specific integrase [Novosphingobium sp. 1949]|uniref:Site-specific integrase n=1 Tax=Novosphingobium organovorum TaxID=2930092 RepID=A0ABT0BGD8_9SPHN|nr:tyrosine-type recombinase/integrase [Novosphingobium organovorum]MCJ2184093.1 site-specific integrase [Novosphingobium organovorum]